MQEQNSTNVNGSSDFVKAENPVPSRTDESSGKISAGILIGPKSL